MVFTVDLTRHCGGPNRSEGRQDARNEIVERSTWSCEARKETQSPRHNAYKGVVQELFLIVKIEEVYTLHSPAKLLVVTARRVADIFQSEYNVLLSQRFKLHDTTACGCGGPRSLWKFPQVQSFSAERHLAKRFCRFVKAELTGLRKSVPRRGRDTRSGSSISRYRVLRLLSSQY